MRLRIFLSLVAFLAAFAWHCISSTNTVVRAVVGVAWVIFAALVVWCVWIRHEWEADDTPEGEVVASSNSKRTDDAGGQNEKPLDEYSRPPSRSRISPIPVLREKKGFNWSTLSVWPLRRSSGISDQTQV